MFHHSSFCSIKWILLASAFLLLTACRTPPVSPVPWQGGPRIFTIGHKPMLTFDSDKPLLIPIEGYNLIESLEYDVEVSVTGTLQLVRGKDYTVHFAGADDSSSDSFNANKIELTLTPEYLNKVEDGDLLNVSVSVNRKTDLTETVLALEFLKEAIHVLEPFADELQNAESAILEPFINRLQKNGTEPEEKAGDDAWEQIKKEASDVKESLERYKDAVENYRKDADSLLDDILKEPEYGDKNFDLYEKRLAARKIAIRFEMIISFMEEKISPFETISVFDENTDSAKLLSRLKGASSDKYSEKIKSLQESAEISRLIASCSSISEGLSNSLATSSRQFTLYNVEKYREQFQQARILPSDISAFPLPYDDVVDYFGEYLAERFFVVRLSIRNNGDTEKLINTGMISVSGRAMVEVRLEQKKKSGLMRFGNWLNDWFIKGKKMPKIFRYTVPIEVSPHSKEQVYTALDDTEVQTARARWFRMIEFTGALASSAFAAFEVSNDLLTGTTLFTGVVIPEGKKLFPNPYPNYRRNVVNFAMNDLVKIPKNGTTAHKFLFFPRTQIEAVISDTNSYGEIKTSNLLDILKSDDRIGFEQPQTHVISLVFDNMTIPLEEVFKPAELLAEPSADNDR